MNPTLEEVQTLIRSIASLSEEQRVRFLQVLPKLDANQLTNLKTTLLKVQNEETQKMKANIEVLTVAGAAHQEWKADKARTSLQAQESSSAQADASSAENLLSKL